MMEGQQLALDVDIVIVNSGGIKKLVNWSVGVGRRQAGGGR